MVHEIVTFIRNFLELLWFSKFTFSCQNAFRFSYIWHKATIENCFILYVFYTPIWCLAYFWKSTYSEGFPLETEKTVYCLYLHFSSHWFDFSHEKRTPNKTLCILSTGMWTKNEQGLHTTLWRSCYRDGGDNLVTGTTRVKGKPSEWLEKG